MLHHERLEESVAPLRRAIQCHPIHRQLVDLASLRRFMESHVFAAWTLLPLTQSLSHDLTDIGDARSGPAISPEHAASNFDLCLEAMDELGADTTSIAAFVGAVRKGVSPRRALASVPPPAAFFVREALYTIATGKAHRIAAACLFARDDLVHPTAERIVDAFDVKDRGAFRSFHRWLAVERDAHARRPYATASEALRASCGNDAKRWMEAGDAACAALRARVFLWDGVVEQLQADRVFRNRRARSGLGDTMISNADVTARIVRDVRTA